MKSQYLEYANKAAELERNGELIKAAFAWECAANNARNLKNEDWADARSHFCHEHGRLIKGKAA